MSNGNGRENGNKDVKKTNEPLKEVTISELKELIRNMDQHTILNVSLEGADK